MASYSVLVMEQLLAPEKEPDLERVHVSNEYCDFGFMYLFILGQMAVVGSGYPFPRREEQFGWAFGCEVFRVLGLGTANGV